MEDLFADVASEGNTLDIDKAFERLETKGEAPSESRTEKEGEATGGDEKSTQEAPKDSKAWAQMRREIREAKEAAATAKAEADALKNSSKAVELPKWYVDRYGDTEESKKNYAQITQKEGELDWIKNQVLSDLDQRTQAEQATATAGEQYVDTQLQEMSEEGLKFERNELLKFMVDFQKEFGAGSLLDTEGNYDFRKSLALMERLQPEEAKENVNKTLASQASRSKVNSPSTSKIPVVNTRVLRKGGWRDAGI